LSTLDFGFSPIYPHRRVVPIALMKRSFVKANRSDLKYISMASLFNGVRRKLSRNARSDEMSAYNQRPSVLRRLERLELRAASMWVAAKWFEQFVGGDGRAGGSAKLAEFGAFEPNLAEVIVLDHGFDFVFPTWGVALNTLCGGDHRGHRLSMLPQPSRGQLRRVCVRAAAAQAPVADQATWVVDGQIWQCAMLAMPTAGDEFSATRLLVALLFAPHPIFAAQLERSRAGQVANRNTRHLMNAQVAYPGKNQV
jgi:hypothetical protein